MINSFVTTISKGKNKAIKSNLLKKIAGSFGLKIANTGLGLVRSLMLARWLGVEGLGAYTFALTWIGLLGMVTKLGIPGLLQREISIYKTQSNWGLVKGILNWSQRLVLILSLILIPLAITIAWFIGKHHDSQMILALSIGLLSLPLETLIEIELSAIKGMHKVILAQLPNLLIFPSLLVIFTFCSYFVFAEKISVFIILGVYFVANLITLLISSIIKRKIIAHKINSVKAEYQNKTWFKSSLALMFLGCMGMINAHTDVLMLGTLKGAKDVGIYVVVNRISSLIIFIVMAANTVIAPSISSLYASGNLRQLQQLITKSSRGIFSVSLLVGGVIITFNHWLLLAFGKDFIQGKYVLIVLILGQLFNALVGQVNLLLTMTGNARYTAFSVGIGGGANIILNFVLIPQYGVLGAGIATSISMIIWNSISLFYVKQKLKIDSTCLGLNYL